MGMNEVLFDLLMGVVIVLSVLITKHLIPFLRQSVNDTEYEQLLDIIAVAVRAAEQTIKESGQGKAKKAEVVAFVSAWLADRNIHITEAQLDKLIEAAVYVMNKEK